LQETNFINNSSRNIWFDFKIENDKINPNLIEHICIDISNDHRDITIQ
jgi:hypothetical protein